MSIEETIDQLHSYRDNYVLPFLGKIKIFVTEKMMSEAVSLYKDRLPTIRQFTYEKGFSDENVIYAIIILAAIIFVYLVFRYKSPTNNILIFSTNKGPCRWRKDSRQPMKTSTRWLCGTCGEYVFTYDRRPPKNCERGRWRDYL